MLFFRETWGEWNQAPLGLPRPEKNKTLLVLTILLISISKSPKTAYLSEHYSFRDKIFFVKKGSFIPMNKQQLLDEAEL